MDTLGYSAGKNATVLTLGISAIRHQASVSRAALRAGLVLTVRQVLSGTNARGLCTEIRITTHYSHLLPLFDSSCFRDSILYIAL